MKSSPAFTILIYTIQAPISQALQITQATFYSKMAMKFDIYRLH